MSVQAPAKAKRYRRCRCGCGLEVEVPEAAGLAAHLLEADGRARESWLAEPHARDSRGELRDPSGYVAGWLGAVAERTGLALLGFASRECVARVAASFAGLAMLARIPA